jgi:hypothetical protein
VVAPNADRRKPPVAVPRAAIVGGRNCIRLRLGRDVRLLGCCYRNCAVPRNVGQCQLETFHTPTGGRRLCQCLSGPRMPEVRISLYILTERRRLRLLPVCGLPPDVRNCRRDGGVHQVNPSILEQCAGPVIPATAARCGGRC